MGKHSYQVVIFLDKKIKFRYYRTMISADEMVVYSNLYRDLHNNDENISHAEKITYNVLLNLPKIFSKMMNYPYRRKIAWGLEDEDDIFQDSPEDWVEISERIMDRLRSAGFEVSRISYPKNSIAIEW